MVALSFAGGLLHFSCTEKYKVGKTAKVKLTLVYGKTVETPIVTVLLVTVDPTEDGTYLCSGVLQVPDKKMPALLMQFAYAGLEGADRRASRRLPCTTRIISRELTNFQAVTTNIGNSGAEMLCDGAVAVGAFMNLQFDLEIVGAPELTIQGQCIWCAKLAGEAGRVKYRVGVTFPPQHAETLEIWSRFYLQVRGVEGASVMLKTLDTNATRPSAPREPLAPPGPPPRLAQPEAASESGRWTRPPLPQESTESGRWARPVLPAEPSQPTPPPAAAPPEASESGGWSQLSVHPSPWGAPPTATDSGKWAQPTFASQPTESGKWAQPPSQPNFAPEASESGKWTAPAATTPTFASDSGRWSQPASQPPVPAAESGESGRWTQQQAPPSFASSNPADSGRWSQPSPGDSHGSGGFPTIPPPASISETTSVGSFQLPPIGQAMGFFEPPRPPAPLEKVEPLGIKGADFMFRSRGTNSTTGRREVMLDLSHGGQVSSVEIAVNVSRAEPTPDGYMVCWCQILEDEEKIRIFNQLLGTPG